VCQIRIEANVTELKMQHVRTEPEPNSYFSSYKEPEQNRTSTVSLVLINKVLLYQACIKAKIHYTSLPITSL